MIRRIVREADMEFLILVYNQRGGGQPKEVWWFKKEAELKQKQSELAAAGEEFIVFEGKIRVMFH
jgi:hypothetical protein